MPTPQALLKQIARIQDMERGALCRMSAGPYYNHQRWLGGRNLVRYVPKAQLPALRAAIAGYRKFRRLTDAYAELIIRRSRQRRVSATASAPKPKKIPARPKNRKN
ncbi:MAG: hypothetical protein IT577_16680 [Verrucomicrobiae bacterium]|nr:hypothetical protein [Verrucomicrobiae bacterium]